ncbi:hypothetical protein JCM17846_13010 [Iodidimonas nitroreducens]|uniref:DUF2125 domain-containing protein n=1 Tax=Iodidimonas nitroreducens TaxID=1236968 RepID=A0A5A7N975_9PROT|nr:DUF2125 domain-containing protein [Iodidimonas nitroreducens]GAK33666.1 hypothetical protein AQ1_01556 [alpha proteobacterium Q-1]GER03619.1 hypothetical protein JCM17846_13010 [Iodidimonas nitroreducens]
MKYRILIGTFLLAALAYGALWHFIANESRDRISTWFGDRDQQAFRAQNDQIDISGFPYRLTINIARPRIESQNSKPAWAAAADQLLIFSHLWTPDHQVAQAHDLKARLADLRLHAPKIMASLLTGAQEQMLDMDLGMVSFDFPASKGQVLPAERMRLNGKWPLSAPPPSAPDQDETPLLQNERADIAIQLTNLALGPFAPGAPAPVISKIELRGELHGLITTPITAQSLEKWRDAGGTIEITDLQIDWGRLHLKGDGSLTLDEQLRPLGALALVFEEPGLLVTYLAKQGLIDPKSAPYLAEGVDQIAMMGGDRAMRLPITLQDGQILAGPFPVAKISPLLKP